MINRVVAAGRITEPLRPRVTPQGPVLDLTLELKHPSWGKTDLESCTVLARIENPRLIEIAEKFLEPGRDLLVQGFLRRDGDDLLVRIEQLNFMERDLNSRDFRSEAWATPAVA